MTDDQKRRQYADLLLEQAEAAQHLAHLKEHMRRLQICLTEADSWLQRAHSYAHGTLDPTFETFSEGERINLAGDPKYREAINCDELVSTVRSLFDARKRLLGIENTLHKLNLP